MVPTRSGLTSLFSLTTLIISVVARDMGAYLAINSMGFVDENENLIHRRLEVNWYGTDDLGPDSNVWVNVYDQSPEGTTIEPILSAPINGFTNHHNVTDIMLPIVTDEEMWRVSQCIFPFWVQLVDGTNQDPLTSPRCLRSQPSWMMDHKEAFADLAIGDLMLIASHDAASYRYYSGEDELTELIAGQIYTQEESLLHQLIWGVRFLDIRVAHYPEFTDEQFWLVHSVALVRSLREGIEQVQKFMRNTEEIVIWDTHTFFREWDDLVHEEYLQILQEEFGSWWVRPSGKGWNLTLGDIWDQDVLVNGQGRMIFINEDADHADPNLFFPNIPEFWGDKDEVEDLKVYLDSVVNVVENTDGDVYRPWRPNCQLTGNVEDFLTQKYSGLREMADVVNRQMTDWWRTDYQDLTHVYSLHDYFLGTDMIQIAIDRNLNLARQRKLNY
ncbi:PI-PLC X domain-containing protein 1-like isoform X2 [Tigriopus californicus]|uniref:PI-PLC X domain-containing protein 1-like isoform X2 n=1 Tax=Tigriopus californicus TaxID=6832 RepID=UPI0027DA38DC|nr:PI-PLC X domain-containing protein 1-like isoform X2 [Tigriopus californicus]